tara:strand:+ start:758 stop:1243 length:486 start_codon:yes stop_codon:yes gene_type:complete
MFKYWTRADSGEAHKCTCSADIDAENVEKDEGHRDHEDDEGGSRNTTQRHSDECPHTARNTITKSIWNFSINSIYIFAESIQDATLRRLMVELHRGTKDRPQHFIVHFLPCNGTSSEEEDVANEGEERGKKGDEDEDDEEHLELAVLRSNPECQPERTSNI